MDLDVTILEESFKAIAAAADTPSDIAEDFYAQVYARGGPAVIGMFPKHMAHQRGRLLDALVTIVSQAGDLDTLAGFLAGLGRDHRKYEVAPEHFGLVGECLLVTLAKYAELPGYTGPPWDGPVAATWAAAYDLVAQVMIAALTADDGVPRWWDATVTGIERRGLDVAVLQVQPDTGNLTWAPGQSFGVKIASWPGPGQPPQAWRFYSPAGTPADGTIELHVKIVPGGMSAALASKRITGARLRLSPPLGNLRADLATGRDVVMIAGSTGLAPLLSILRAYATQPRPPQAALFFGAAWPDGLYYGPELARLARQWPWLTVTTAISGPQEETPGWDGERGLITDVAMRGVAGWHDRDGYVCGPTAMVTAARHALRTAGAATIHAEDYGA